MQNFNYHTHTFRCRHADFNLTDEDYVKLFIEQGFKKIAFTDHCPEKEMIDPRSNMRMKYDQLDEYLNSIKSLKEKYKDIIEIETGFEVEYVKGNEQYLLELKKQTNKILLGQHFIYDENAKDIKIFRWHNFNDEELLEYAECIRLAILYKIPDIIAHPDLYMLGRKEFGNIEEKVAHVICSAAEASGVPLEINLTEPVLYLVNERDSITYPCKEFWALASQYKNLKVLYGVDAHYKNQIELYKESMILTNNHIGQNVIDKLNFCNENLEINNIKKI